MLINLEDPVKKPDTSVPLFRLGFRPFFLLAGISGAILILLWGLAYYSDGLNSVYGSVYWHGHEMVFGYVMAVVSGFLLTGVKNWTGRQTANGFSLLMLSLLWLSARVLPLLPDGIPYWMIALIDIAFLPAVAVAILPLLLKTKNTRNLVFVGIVMLLTASNVIFHLGVSGLIPSGQRYGLYAGVYMILILISVMGGRVIPFFIEKGIGGGFTRKSYRAIEIGSTVSLILLALLHSSNLSGDIVAAVAFITALFHLIRLSGWYGHGVWRVPLLWALVLAYAWIIIGLFLLSFAMLGYFPASLAIHALTIGGIGLMTMGMMVRVSMGHSGRNLSAPSLLPAAFGALNLAVIVRVFLPMLMPDLNYPVLVLVSALIWVAAFAVFVFQMAPVYFSPRVDGRSG